MKILRDREERRRREKKKANSKITRSRYNVAGSSGHIYIGFLTERKLPFEQSISQSLRKLMIKKAMLKAFKQGACRVLACSYPKY